MVEIFDCEQNTDEWLRVRLGIPTASKFATVMAKGKDGKSDSKTRRDYLLDLVGERITGEPADAFSNRHTERGHEVEPDARALYEIGRAHV